MNIQQFNKTANFSFRTGHSGSAIRNVTVFLLVYLMKPVHVEAGSLDAMYHKHWTLLNIPQEIFRYSSHLIM